MEAVERLAPPALAEHWDNVGLLVGRRDRPVTRVLAALDLRAAVLDEAAARGCQAVLTHHPVIFPAAPAVSDASVTGDLVLRAAEERIAVVAAHTNLDSAPGGLNDVMAELLGLRAPRPLRPVPDHPSAGLGRVGEAGDATVAAVAARVAGAFGDPPVAFTGPADRPVAVVACCTGSGASLIGDAVAAGADLYVTSDLKYHDADRAAGTALLCLPHGRAESVALVRWLPALAAALGPAVEVVAASAGTDPWRAAPPDPV